ncbi:annexin domain-containing protein [Ditylenchus destructor]|uniref:Annexin domain-containing protein n=1 Tax=Ditylenchus destructor TaxID=166010 RepID=A0AAD4NDU6_9BILA|nr:annexin domain-containing protein [Ditylenchus destructor]
MPTPNKNSRYFIKSSNFAIQNLNENCIPVQSCDCSNRACVPAESYVAGPCKSRDYYEESRVPTLAGGGMYRHFSTNSPSPQLTESSSSPKSGFSTPSTPRAIEKDSKAILTPPLLSEQSTIDEDNMITSPITIHVPTMPIASNPIYGVGVDILSELDRQKPQHNGHKKDSADSQQLRRTTTKSSSSSNEANDRKKRLTMPLIYRMYESQSEDLRGTVRGPDEDDFRPEEASKSLRLALSGGIQSNDKAIINVMLAHNNFQRQKIAAAYEGMYNRKLAEDIEEEAGGYFLDAVLALIQPAHIYSTRTLYYAISGRTYSRSIAVDIALTSTAPQLKVLRDTYQSEFRIALERDVNVKVEGLFGKMLLQLLMRGKDFEVDVDVELAERQVELLHASGGVEEIGRNLDLFTRLFGSQGLNQIRTFLERYDSHAMNVDGEIRGKDFESVIRKNVNIHSDVKQMLLLFVRISRNMQLYFAEKLHEAISGTRPDHSSIIRILVSRSEIDLHDICDEYKRKYGHHVVFDLQNTCSGDFLRLLNQLVNPCDYSDIEVFD